MFTDFNTIITLKSCNIQFVYPKGDMYGWWCGCVVVGWMLVTEMMGLMWVWDVIRYIGASPYANIYCPYRALDNPEGV